jgi:hypothetical protein
MLKTIKIPTIVPTCFGSRRNYHQGAILYLAKTTQLEIAPWWWFLRELKHVGAIVRILIVFNIPMIL